MVDLSCTYAGVPVKNPLIVGGGSTTASPKSCEKAAKHGWAGVVLKANATDDVIKEAYGGNPTGPMRIPRPFYKLVDTRARNKWRPVIPKVRGKREPGKRAGKVEPNYELAVWNQNTLSPYVLHAGICSWYNGLDPYLEYINRTKELVQDYDCKVVANVVSYTEEGWAQQMEMVNRSKADVVELVPSCPALGVYDPRTHRVRRAHGLENLPEIIEKVTKFCVERSNIPVSVKFSPDAPDPVAAVQAAVNGGAKAVQFADCMTVLPPALIINPDTLEAGLFPGAPWGTVISPSWVLPHICGAIARFRLRGVPVDISGCGGVRDYLDVLRLLMAGATSVQACTVTMIEGLGVAEDYLLAITAWMENKGYQSIKEIQGILATREKLSIDASKFVNEVGQAAGGPTPHLKVVVDEKRCINCGWCEQCCPEVAITIDDKVPTFDDKLCEVCGLCVAVCPMEALAIVPRV